MASLIKFISRHQNFINYTECKRYAGHSKWQNIRHIKAQKEGEKQVLIKAYTAKIRIAIAEGKSAKPETNPKLAKIIEQAKSDSLPMSTIKNFLEKIQKSKIGTQSVFIESRGPSGSIALIHILTDNINRTRQNINHHSKKSAFSQSEISKQSSFLEKGIILTEVKHNDMDLIMNDAIEVGAEEADKLILSDKEFVKFICSPLDLMKVKKNLEDLNYKVTNADLEYTPQTFVELSDEELDLVCKFQERLETMEEVAKVYFNVS